MRIALVGVSGHVGSRILDELLRRGHTVTGIARDVKSVVSRPGLELRVGEARSTAGLEPLLASHDAVISATRFVSSDPKALIAAVRQSAVPRLLVVGGAGSLEVAPGLMLVDAPDFPEAYRAESLAGRDCLSVLRAEPDFDWTVLCPSAEFMPGERTGKFRLGGDQLLTGADGRSWISMEDFALAMVDELENPRHNRQRFTIGY
ncbi:MAG: putative NADH-flavin reductase [Bryobacterales bacterium]|jgi:putative NADH-flavin reductase|nr:putative NADH-flavin reductase [Bryobacterales bacterium]